jgi:hypothetical protein
VISTWKDTATIATDTLTTLKTVHAEAVLLRAERDRCFATADEVGWSAR